MRPALALSLAATFLGSLPGCGASCEEACRNFAAVCADDFQASGISFDQARCSEACDSNLEGCTNQAERLDCLADAQACRDARACPLCRK